MAALLILVGINIYFIPAVVAGMRGHHNTGAIVALNVLLGWTFLGWALALVWALTVVDHVEPKPARRADSAVGAVAIAPREIHERPREPVTSAYRSKSVLDTKFRWSGED